MAKKKKTDDADEETEEKGKSKLPMIIGAVVALGAVYNFVLKPAPVEEEPMAMVDVEPIEGEIFELEEMIINIDDPNVQYVRVAMAIILEEGTLAADFELQSAIAKDVILTDLSGRTSEQLGSAQGKEQIKAELSEELREAYGDAMVVRVLFTALVMQ